MIRFCVAGRGSWVSTFLAIRPWEPYFKTSEAKMSSVAVWVRLPELPIEFYDIRSVKGHWESHWTCASY